MIFFKHFAMRVRGESEFKNFTLSVNPTLTHNYELFNDVITTSCHASILD